MDVSVCKRCVQQALTTRSQNSRFTAGRKAEEYVSERWKETPLFHMVQLSCCRTGCLTAPMVPRLVKMGSRFFDWYFYSSHYVPNVAKEEYMRKYEY